MENKRFLALFTALILLTCCFLPSAIAEKSTWSAILDAMEKETGYPPDAFRKNQLEGENGVYTFSVVLKNPPEDEDGLYVGGWSKKNGLEITQPPSKLPTFAQMDRDMKACFFKENCYELLYQYEKKWRAEAERMLAQGEDDSPSRNMALLHFMLPGDIDLPYHKVVEMAFQHLANQPGWDREKADMFFVTMNAIYQPEDMDWPVWFFSLNQHSPLEGNEYSNDSYYDKYEKKLKKMFNGNPPIHIGVVMNAMTGELEEPIMMDYPPVRFHYADFILRPAPFLEAVAEKKAAEGWD